MLHANHSRFKYFVICDNLTILRKNRQLTRGYYIIMNNKSKALLCNLLLFFLILKFGFFSKKDRFQTLYLVFLECYFPRFPFFFRFGGNFFDFFLSSPRKSAGDTKRRLFCCATCTNCLLKKNRREGIPSRRLVVYLDLRRKI